MSEEDTQCEFVDRDVASFNCWRKQKGLGVGDVECLVCVGRLYSEIALTWMGYTMSVGAEHGAMRLMRDYEKAIFLTAVLSKLAKKVDPEGYETAMEEARKKMEKMEERNTFMRRMTERRGEPLV